MGFEHSGKSTEDRFDAAGSEQKGNGESASRLARTADLTNNKSGESHTPFKGQLAEKLRTLASKQIGRAADDLNNVAIAFRQTGESLQENDQETFAGYANAVADRVERISGGLRQSNIDSALSRVKSLARENPAAFMGGAFALGVLFAHFLKGRGSETISSHAPTHDFSEYHEEVISYAKH